MSINHKESIHNLRHLDGKVDAINNDINDFMLAQANGEAPDPAQFTELLEKRVTAQQAMQAQFKLNEKPLKTVLNETR